MNSQTIFDVNNYITSDIINSGNNVMQCNNYRSNGKERVLRNVNAKSRVPLSCLDAPKSGFLILGGGGCSPKGNVAVVHDTEATFPQ